MNALVDTSVDPLDDTGLRILAYLHSLEPMGNEPCTDLAGRELLERMAVESAGTDDTPSRHLSITQCVHVLEFMATTEPKELHEPEGVPSANCGFLLVVNALIESLRAPAAEARS